MEFDVSKIGEYTVEDLDRLAQEFQATLDEKFDLESPTADDVAAAEAADEALSAIQEEKGKREDVTQRMSALKESRATASTQADEDGDEADDDEEDEGGEEFSAEEQESAPKTKTPPAKVSARSRTAGRRPVQRQEEEEVEEGPGVTITASADVANFSAGTEMDGLFDVAKGIAARVRAMPKYRHNPNASMVQLPVAQFSLDTIPDDLIANGQNDYEVVERAANEHRLEGDSLVAAGGWCAPSETWYDLCAVEGSAGMISLPEFGVSRGGVRYTEGPDFADLYNAGFTQTEAEAIAGEAKPCLELECPEFDEVRLDASGICIRIPLLTQVGYPELIENVTSRALLAHRHSVSADLIQRMVTIAGTAEVVPAAGSTAFNVLSSLEIIAARKRQEYRLDESTTMEVVVPMWVKSAVRADLALRNGVDLISVSDQQVVSHFSARNLRVQFVYGWQDLAADAVAYPATLQALIYPAGTYTKGTSSVINLSAVYDHASLTQNMYTGLFFEEGILLLQRCYTPSLIEVAVCNSGQTGAADLTDCFVAGATP